MLVGWVLVEGLLSFVWRLRALGPSSLGSATPWASLLPMEGRESIGAPWKWHPNCNEAGVEDRTCSQREGSRHSGGQPPPQGYPRWGDWDGTRGISTGCTA